MPTKRDYEEYKKWRKQMDDERSERQKRDEQIEADGMSVLSALAGFFAGKGTIEIRPANSFREGAGAPMTIRYKADSP